MEVLSRRLQHVVWIVTLVGVSYFLTSSFHFPPVFLSNFRHFPLAEMEATRQRALVLTSAMACKKEKEGASTSAPKVIGKGSLKRKNEGKANCPLKKGSVILVGNKQKKLSPSKPNHGAGKGLMTVTSPSPRGPCIVFLRIRSTLLRWWSPSSRMQTSILVLSRWQKSRGRQVFLTFLGCVFFFFLFLFIS